MTKFSLLLLGFLTACGTAPDVPPLRPWPALPTGFAAVADLDEAVTRFPNSSALHQRRLDLALNAGDREVSLQAARRLAAMGAGLPPPVRESLSKVAGAEAASLFPLFDANAAPIGTSSVYSAIPTHHRLIEGLIRDPRSGNLYAASVVSRSLLLLKEGASAQPIEVLSGIGSLLTGAFDARSNRLWLVASVVDQTPKEGGRFTGLLEVDPDSLSVLRRIGLPDGAEAGPNDLVIADDGMIYVSDMVTGAIYRCAPGCTSLETFIAPRTLRSAHGLAASADGKWLYAADFRYGLAAIQRGTGRVIRVAAPDTMMLDGIDGLLAYKGDLVAIQGGSFPSRIVRLKLSPDGTSVRSLEVLERANPAWSEPTLGTIAGQRLLYVADAQWERFGPGGVTSGDRPLKSTGIRSLKLD